MSCIEGDIQYKPFVSSDAEELEVMMDGREEYLVLACDGLWDVVTATELPAIVYNYMAESGGEASGIAKYLVQYAKDNDSMDNISVIVIVFRENLAEPVADAGFLDFLTGGGNSGAGDGADAENSQGSKNCPGSNTGDKTCNKSGADNSGEAKGDSNDDNQGKDNSGHKAADGESDGSRLSNNKSRENTRPELLININHMSFDIGPTKVIPSEGKEVSELDETNDDADVETESEASSQTLESSSKRGEDLDCYGVFNTRLMDGPIDLSRIDDTNSSALLKNIADDVYNLTPQTGNSPPPPPTVPKLQNRIFIPDFDKDDDSIFQEPVTTERYFTKKKAKKSKLDGNLTERKRRDGKKNNNSPVCWAFAGKNRATVQNYKLKMAAQTRGSNQLFVDNVPNVKPPAPKFAQVYSSTENIHDIANITHSSGKLDKLPLPRPKVLPSNLAKLSGITVYGSKTYPQKESQKFHTTWRPRKPLKPIASIVYETPPTPFVNSRFKGIQ